MKTLLALPLALALSGCITMTNPVPEGYKGPVVPLADTGYQEDSGKGRFFAALEIDGHQIENSIRETRIASYNHGPVLTSRYTTRNVPVAPMKVKLTGTHQTAAPIQEIASRVAGTFFSVEGVADFSPIADHLYMVTGELKKEHSCVWIADKDSSEPVTKKICTQEK
ncbi:MAG: hypothetical protein HGA47_06455 [Zoogloea sp.]|nr:hypothetical protein [Zoogloea sp.]